jgi:hypothetical protein
MKKIEILLFIILFFCFPLAGNSAVIFSSKWDNTGNDDGGNWDDAYVDSGNITLSRVSGDQSSLGGPTGSPPLAPNTTYFLRETWVPNGQDCQVYLQEYFSDQTDLYMGMWFYFNTGITFIDSVKFMDFRTLHQAVGNGHLVLFGFDHNAYYAANGNYPNDAGTWWSSNGTDHNLIGLKYLASAGNNVINNEESFNYYNYSPIFDSNLNTSETIVGRSGYNPNSVNRVHIEGGYWIAAIIHAKIHATNGEMDMWIKKGDNPLYKVMEWNRNTVWASDNSSPHDFYTINGTGAIDHIQINAYWNNWPSASGTRRIWISNVVIATTLDEVKNYLGLDGGGSVYNESVGLSSKGFYSQHLRGAGIGVSMQ